MLHISLAGQVQVKQLCLKGIAVTTFVTINSTDCKLRQFQKACALPPKGQHEQCRHQSPKKYNGTTCVIITSSYIVYMAYTSDDLEISTHH